MPEHSETSQLLAILERLLELPAADLKTALTLACDAIAGPLRADKVDAFLFDPSKSSLVAIGTSTQPLSSAQRRHGLDMLPIANGGRFVEVYQTRAPYRSGRVRSDPAELKGIRDALGIESQLGVPIEVAGQIRGVLGIASQKPDFFTERDERFAISVGKWVGTIAHRAELVEAVAANAVDQGRRAVAEELVTILAHDLRNLLAPVAGRLQLLRRRAEQEKRDADQRDADSALRSVERLGVLVTDILDVARIDQGVFHLELAPVDLVHVMEEVARTLSSPAHEVRVAASEEELIVTADRARITQCIENVVANAIRHSPNDSPVTVLVAKKQTASGAVGSVEVIDEGPGVPVEIMPRIFERFATGNGSNGLGLGLYLARRIAVAHGGELKVASPTGRGARFCLELPLGDRLR